MFRNTSSMFLGSLVTSLVRGLSSEEEGEGKPDWVSFESIWRKKRRDSKETDVRR